MIEAGSNYINPYGSKYPTTNIVGTNIENRFLLNEEDQLKPQFCNVTSSFYKAQAISTSVSSQNSFYKENISEANNILTNPCNDKIQVQQTPYPPHPSSTGSASPSSTLSASTSPSIFPSPSSYSSVSSSQSEMGNNYAWNAYTGISTRPQFTYPQYAPEYYGNMGMSASAAAAGAWFSHPERLYQPWSAAAPNSYGFNFEDIAFQTQLQRRSVRCTCPNCTNEMSGLPPIVGPDERGRKQHICHIPGCERLYGKASHLKTHLRWHTGERPFLCLTCGKRFSRSDELQRHGRTHTNYRPYSCPICSKKFSRSDHLSKHKKTHFKDKKSKKTESKEIVKKEQTDNKISLTQREEIQKSSIQLQTSTQANVSISVQPSQMTLLKTELNSPITKTPQSDIGYVSYNLYQTSPLFSQSHHHHQSMGLFYNRTPETSQFSTAANHPVFDQTNPKHASSVIGYHQQSPSSTTSINHSYINVQQGQNYPPASGISSQQFEPLHQLSQNQHSSITNQYSDLPSSPIMQNTSNYYNHSHHHAWTNYHQVSQRS